MLPYAKLKGLRLKGIAGDKGRGIVDSFEKVARKLERTEERGVVQIRILAEDEEHYWRVEMEKGECRLHEGSIQKPSLEIITREETWREISEGSLSPMEAFLHGRMRVRGDLKMGIRILKRLATDEKPLGKKKG